jgi:FkbM family methyltransferase
VRVNWKTQEIKGLLLRNLYLRGRLKELARLCQVRVLRKTVENTEALEWFVRDSSKVLMKIDSEHNFKYLLKNEMVTDGLPLAKYLEKQSGLIAVDIGANRGYITVVLARRFEKVYAFEPNRLNRQVLEETLLINSVKNVDTIEAALSSSNVPAMMRVSTSHGHHTLETSHLTKAIDIEKVETYRFDEFAGVRDIESIDLVKIDVEGHELSVLNGFGHSLNPDVIKKIVFEHSLSLSRVQGRSEYEVIDFLNAAGYEVQTLDGEVISRNQISSILQADLVAVPSSSPSRTM